MCGFAGFMCLNGHRDGCDEREAILAAMARQLSLRGPDDEQFFDDGLLSLVFRRLSIIDVAGGRQPMWNEDQTILAAVNGEIYNFQSLRNDLEAGHQFNSCSDSEVVLHLYEEHGDNFLQFLNGMFALLIWDTKRQRLLLARDRLGIKPLYYALKDDVLYFASELKALLAHPNLNVRINWQDLKWFEEDQPDYLPTYVEGIHHLHGGRTLSFDSASGTTTNVYWDIERFLPRDFNHAGQPTREQYIDGYIDLISDSVTQHLVSDVPVGMFLSGGIDSALMAHLAAEHNNDLVCFTVADENTYSSGDVRNAENLSRALGLEQHTVLYDHATFLDDIAFDLMQFERLIWLMDSPRFDIEWLFKYELHKYAQTHSPGMKVMLIGQGADEFTGGYSSRLDNSHVDWEHYLTDEVKAEQCQRSARSKGIPERIASMTRLDAPVKHEHSLAFIYQQQLKFFRMQLQYFNLWHEDRTSSGNGVEARVPYLDHRLVEFLLSVPVNMYEELFWNKTILREAVARLMPDYPSLHPKMSFFIGDKMHTIHAMGLQMVERIYQPFMEKYLDSGTSIFERRRLQQLHYLASQKKEQSLFAAWRLIECMAIEIFAGLVTSNAPAPEIFFVRTASPLRRVSDADFLTQAS